MFRIFPRPLMLAFVLLLAFPFAVHAFKTITVQDLAAKRSSTDMVIVDTRLNDAYNGWKLDGVKRGGHIPGAVDFSANWLAVDAKNKQQQLLAALETKGITKDKQVVLYDANGKDAQRVADYLKGLGYSRISLFNIKEWVADCTLPLETYSAYWRILPARVLKDVIDGKRPETFENTGQIKIMEASWGPEKQSYAKGHVPGAVHINTDWIEPPIGNPAYAWMLASPDQLETFARAFGFTKDDTVILTAAEPMAAYRLAIILQYMGVKDARVLNGGFDAWKQAGYPIETKSNPPRPNKDFGVSIPLRPGLIDTMEEVKTGLAAPKYFTLVDNRTWDEHIGKVSGYTYHDKKGRIPGSIYGYAGYDSAYGMEHYRNIDKTMRNIDEIRELWESAGINLNTHLSFMCGSGWRVAEILTYARVMGMENTSIFSDGWIGWSNTPGNPVATGTPE